MCAARARSPLAIAQLLVGHFRALEELARESARSTDGGLPRTRNHKSVRGSVEKHAVLRHLLLFSACSSRQRGSLPTSPTPATPRAIRSALTKPFERAPSRPLRPLVEGERLCNEEVARARRSLHARARKRERIRLYACEWGARANFGGARRRERRGFARKVTDKKRGAGGSLP